MYEFLLFLIKTCLIDRSDPEIKELIERTNEIIKMKIGGWQSSIPVSREIFDIKSRAMNLAREKSQDSQVSAASCIESVALAILEPPPSKFDLRTYIKCAIGSAVRSQSHSKKANKARDLDQIYKQIVEKLIGDLVQ